MLGTSLETMGGISSVISVYKQAGLFDRWPIIYISTHSAGGVARKIWTATFALVRYIGLLLTARVGIVHAHSASGASFWRKSIFVLLGLALRRRVIVHLHGGGFMKFYEGRKYALSKRFIRFVLDSATIVVVLTESWKDSLSSITSNSRIVVVRNPMQGVDIEGVWNRGGERGYLLFLSRINRAKGIFDLLEAVAHIRKSIPNVRLKCAGDDGLTVARRVTELDIDDCVEILGWIQGDAKRELLANAAVYVLPSYMEGLPMGILEAMSAGLAVVSTTVGGIPDVIEHGVEGLLVSPGDVVGLAKGIELLLRDASLRRRMGKAGRKKVQEQFAPEKVLPLIENLYAELLGAQGRSPSSA
jgi:glycosyltransferase involved in cell wall biosynthesis